jgi:hypothetical protein
MFSASLTTDGSVSQSAQLLLSGRKRLLLQARKQFIVVWLTEAGECRCFVDTRGIRLNASRFVHSILRGYAELNNFMRIIGDLFQPETRQQMGSDGGNGTMIPPKHALPQDRLPFVCSKFPEG